MAFMVDWCSISIQVFFCELSQSAEVRKLKKKKICFFFNLDSLAAKVLEFVRLGQSNTLVQDLEGRVEWRLYFCCTCFFF